MLNFRMSKNQLIKIAEYFIDLSKLLMGSTFIAIFAPSSTRGKFDAITFILGLLLAVVSFSLGVKLTPSSI
ncbi:MAG: hypothetical protein V1770_01180 [bacterium]